MTTGVQPVEKPGRRTHKALPSVQFLILNGFTVLALLVWWLYAQWVPVYLLPGPGAVFARMFEFVTTPHLLRQLGATALHVIISITIAFVIGTTMAVSAHYVGVTRKLIDGRLTPFLNSFSGIGWLFLAILWFGMDSFTVIFAVTMILIPFTAINIRTGLMEQDRELVELGQSLTRNSLRVATRILVPMLVPYLFAALRTSFGVSWKVVLTAELFGGNIGVGYLLNVARQEFDTETIFAILVFILIFVALVEAAVFRPAQRALDQRYQEND